MRTDPAAFGAGAARVAGVLQQAGHRVWFVGGCVRNLLMGQPLGDIDLTTDAPPDQVTAAATAAGLRVVPTGIDHGTVTLIADGQPFEVTTLRRDVATDGRHATVAFADRIEDDAARRDFTMNALYLAPDGTLSDPIGGLPDLQARIVRFIGDPDARIAEDYLRILRFFRFHAQYADPDHGIEAEGLAACAAGADGLEQLSRERIGAEMRKLLSAPDPAPAVAAMARTGVLWRILPGAGANVLTVLVHVEQAAGLAPDWLCRLAALGGEDVAPALRLSRAEAARLDRLTGAMADDSPPGELGYRLGQADATAALALRAALAGIELDPARLMSAKTGSRQRFPLRADDLPPGLTGPDIGRMLRHLEMQWIDSGFLLTKAELLAGPLKGA
jgi:poly(A) polymerase